MQEPNRSDLSIFQLLHRYLERSRQYRLRVAAILLASYSKKARVVLLIALGLVFCLVGLILYQDQLRKREYEGSKTRIPLSLVEFQNIELKPGYSSSFFNVVGRVKNNSAQYTLDEIRLQITMSEALGNHSEVVGQEETTIHVNSPPGQARDFDDSVWFSGLGAPRGKRTWSYRIMYVAGQ
jgi:hypothetical protein